MKRLILGVLLALMLVVPASAGAATPSAHPITVTLVNQGVPNARLAKIARAVNVQITQLREHWPQVPPASVVIGRRRHARWDWPVYIEQSPPDLKGDSPGGHTRGDHHGVPFAEIDAYTFASGELSETISHEVLEMLVNPTTHATVQTPIGARLLEVCDPVEYTSTYAIDGITLEDFVFPSYFQKGAQPPYDEMSWATNPLDLTWGELPPKP